MIDTPLRPRHDRQAVTSERVQRQIDRFLDEAEEAMGRSDWTAAKDRALNVLALDPDNTDAKSYLAGADRRIASLASEAPSEAPGAQIPSPPAASHPSSFANGRYTVKRFLGEGGKKKVYLAHDASLDRDVAFALIKTDDLDEAARERITREAQAMGRLGAHPHIVTVFDIGNEGDQPYLVLPVLAGGDVEGVIERAPEHKLPIEQAIKIAVETCMGLEFVHGKGIVHRDLKPGNVWLTEDGRAMIGDFGLAVATDRTRLTQAGMMVGTVSYMPPEQAMGGEITPRSDLYALGAMLYEMVCGRPPFVGDESVAIIGQHLNTPPVAPTWHQPDCPPALETLILRLLEKDPSKRPGSAAEVQHALQAVYSGHRAGTRETVEPVTSPHEHNPLYQRTFVGREAELKALQTGFDEAVSGQGGLVMVVGEPGIGKTALCEQLMTYVAMRGGKALAGHCYEEGSLSLPYLPFVEAMRAYVLQREPDGLRSDLGTGAADVARIVSEVRDRVDVELRPAGDPEDDRWRLLQAVTGFLRNASSGQPLLLLLEDLHWADRGTLDLLLHVARNLQGARILIVGNYRDVEVDRAHPLSGALADLRRIGSFRSIRLRGLSIDEVQRMMTNIRGQEAALSRAELIHRQTEGNPLFVQEVLRYLVEEGIVVRQNGRYTAADPSAELAIPEGLRDVVGKRLSRLSPECNRLLAIAAVIGRDFNLETLRSLATVDEEALISAIEEAVHIGVLEERSRTGQVSYRFAHAFFRQTLYEEMIAPRRLRLHQEVARALEAQYGARREEHAAELAEHFAQSTDHADLAKAVEYGELAARRAMSVYAYAEAASHLERCLAVQEVLDREDKAKRCDLLLALGKALMPAGEPLKAATDVAEPALNLAEELGSEVRASTACQLALEALWRYGHATMVASPRFSEWVERADKYAAPDSRDRIFANLAKAWVVAGRESLEAWKIRNETLSLARRLEDIRGICRAVTDSLSTSTPQREPDRLRLAEEFANFSAPDLGVFDLGLLVDALGAAFMDHGDRDRADQFDSQLLALAERSKDPILTLFSDRRRLKVLVIDGDLEGAVDEAQGVLDHATSLGASVFGQQFVTTQTRRAFSLLGRGAEALEMDQRLRDSRTALGADALFMREAQSHAFLGGPQAEEMVQEAARVFELRGFNAPTYAVASLLESAVLIKDRNLAADAAARLSHLGNMTAAQVVVARLLGGAAALCRNPSEAKHYYEQALDVSTRTGNKPELALTHLEFAELLLEHYPSEREAAIEHLDFAIAEFRDMKMQPSLERALRHRGLLKA